MLDRGSCSSEPGTGEEEERRFSEAEERFVVKPPSDPDHELCGAGSKLWLWRMEAGCGVLVLVEIVGAEDGGFARGGRV